MIVSKSAANFALFLFSTNSSSTGTEICGNTAQTALILLLVSPNLQSVVLRCPFVRADKRRNILAVSRAPFSIVFLLLLNQMPALPSNSAPTKEIGRWTWAVTPEGNPGVTRGSGMPETKEGADWEIGCDGSDSTARRRTYERTSERISTRRTRRG